MKKFCTFLLLILFLFLTVFGFSACNFLSYDTKENNSSISVKNDIELKNALENLKEETDIVLKTGNYKNLTISKLEYPVKIIAESGTRVKGITIMDGVKNLTIQGVDFDITGIKLANVENVTISNCSFFLASNIASQTGSLVKNLIIKDCIFTNIMDSLTSAIKILQYDGLIVENCEFDGIEYNALQVGNENALGKVIIQGNSFRNIGSRVIYLVSVEKLISCEIVANKFYDNTDSLLLEGQQDDGIKKEDGIYIHSKSESGNICIGQNYWEIIPEKTDLFIVSIATYEISEQSLI